MSQIVLKIPRRDSALEKVAKFAIGQAASAVSGATGLSVPINWDELPFVPGECQIEGFQNLILVDSVEWSTEVEHEVAADARRTVHVPKIDTVKIKRKLDSASAHLQKRALTTKVSPHPWELYFLKGIGNVASGVQTYGFMQVKFMTMKLHNPLISKYEFDISAGEAEESLEISPSTIEWIYHPTSEAQSIIGNKVIKYNVQTGTLS